MKHRISLSREDIMKTSPFFNSSTARETTALSPTKVCMHVLTSAQTDVRVMRAATALVKVGYAVSVVDVDHEESHEIEEDIRGVHLKHVRVSRSFLSTRFDKWTLVRIAKVLVRSALRLIRTPADMYH